MDAGLLPQRGTQPIIAIFRVARRSASLYPFLVTSLFTKCLHLFAAKDLTFYLQTFVWLTVDGERLTVVVGLRPYPF
jgi:hypothetical protein